MPVHRKSAPDLGWFRTTAQVASLFEGVTQNDVQVAIKKGQIPAQKIGYFYLVWLPDVPDEWPGTTVPRQEEYGGVPV